MTLEGIKPTSQGNSTSSNRNAWNPAELSTKTKICLFLASNPLIASGLLIALGVSLPFTWPVTLFLGGELSLVFLSLTAANENLAMENSSQKGWV